MKNSSPKSKRVYLPIPGWVSAVYGLFCIILIPWTAYLSAKLPTRAIAEHYDLSWAGLDVSLVILLSLVAFLAQRKSRWVVFPAIMAGSFLLVDAWFDVVTARAGFHFDQSLLLAIFIEIPVALMSFIIAYHVLARNIH